MVVDEPREFVGVANYGTGQGLGDGEERGTGVLGEYTWASDGEIGVRWVENFGMVE
jgi:hypothetical protein